MNFRVDIYNGVANFLAAYTAVNVRGERLLSDTTFLAAYTAVNSLLNGLRRLRLFLAAYTAVN